MEFAFTVGEAEQTTIEFSRNWFSGKMRILANRKEILSNNILNPSVHFGFRLERSYEFSVGEKEIFKISIRHSKPLFFGAFRPQTYRVYCNDKLLTEYIGR